MSLQYTCLHEESSCVITGGAVDYTEGFVGCMRALLVNGQMMDLRGKVERGEVTYGVETGELYFNQTWISNF